MKPIADPHISINKDFKGGSMLPNERRGAGGLPYVGPDAEPDEVKPDEDNEVKPESDKETGPGKPILDKSHNRGRTESDSGLR